MNINKLVAWRYLVGNIDGILNCEMIAKTSASYVPQLSIQLPSQRKIFERVYHKMIVRRKKRLMEMWKENEH